jgi:hypothetical protein
VYRGDYAHGTRLLLWYLSLSRDCYLEVGPRQSYDANNHSTSVDCYLF